MQYCQVPPLLLLQQPQELLGFENPHAVLPAATVDAAATRATGL